MFSPRPCRCLSCPGQHLIYPLVLRSPTLQESIVVAAASADSQMRWFSAIQSAIETWVMGRDAVYCAVS